MAVAIFASKYVVGFLVEDLSCQIPQEIGIKFVTKISATFFTLRFIVRKEI